MPTQATPRRSATRTAAALASTCRCVLAATGGCAGRRSKRTCSRCRASSTIRPANARTTSSTRYARPPMEWPQAICQHAHSTQLCHGATDAERSRLGLRQADDHAFTRVEAPRIPAPASPPVGLKAAKTPSRMHMSMVHTHLSFSMPMPIMTSPACANRPRYGTRRRLRTRRNTRQRGRR